MKKIIVFLLCLGSFQLSNSQEKGCDLFESCRLFGALGISGVCDGPSWKMTFGGLAGAETVVHRINHNSFVSAGLGISIQGASYKEVHNTDQFEFEIKSARFDEIYEFSGKVALTYIIFPVLYNFAANNGFYGEIGLQPGLLIRAKDKYDDGESVDFKYYVKTFDLGLPIGAGYNIDEQISVGARAVWGLTNFNDTESNSKEHNYMIMGIIRYKFNK